MSTAFSRFIYWLPALSVAVLISVFSTHSFSAPQTSRILIPLFHWLFPSLSTRDLNWIHTAVRKLAHLSEFGVFSALVFHGIRGPRKGWRWDWAVLTLVIAAAYAGLDEWHQSFVPLREAHIRDVLIDSLGALFAQFLVWIYAITHRSPANSTGLRAMPG